MLIGNNGEADTEIVISAKGLNEGKTAADGKRS